MGPIPNPPSEELEVELEMNWRKVVYRDCLTGSDVNGWKPERAALAIEGWSWGMIIVVGVGFDPGS